MGPRIHRMTAFRRGNWVLQWGSLFLAGLVLALAAQAQTSRGTVSGTVTDPSGAVVAGATLALTNTATAVRRSAISNQAGIYRFDAVDLGAYELKVTHPGFNVLLTSAFSVEANRTIVIDAKLELGSEVMAIQVSAEDETLVIRDGPLRGGNFLPHEVSQLPLIELNPLSLARTLPGVIQPSGTMGGPPSGAQSALFSVNGQRVRGNNFLLDGTENNDVAFAGIAQPFTIADAVEEVSDLDSIPR